MSQDRNTQTPTQERRGGLLHHLFERTKSSVKSMDGVKSTLNLGDIQGFVIRGYRMPMVRHFLLKVNTPAAAHKLLGRLVSGDETNAPQTRSSRSTRSLPAPPRGRNLSATPERMRRRIGLAVSDPATITF